MDLRDHGQIRGVKGADNDTHEQFNDKDVKEILMIMIIGRIENAKAKLKQGDEVRGKRQERETVASLASTRFVLEGFVGESKGSAAQVGSKRVQDVEYSCFFLED